MGTLRKSIVVTASAVAALVAPAAILSEYERVDGACDAPLPGVAVRTNMFADASIWQTPNIYQKAMTVTLDGCRLTAAGILSTNKFDTAWSIATKPQPLTAKWRGYAIAFGVASKPLLNRTRGGTAFSCAVTWYDAAGKEISRDPFMLSTRRRMVLMGEVPANAGSFSVQFGFDTPNSYKGDYVTIDSLDVHVLEQATDPAWKKSVWPEPPRVKVVSKSPFTDAKAQLRITVTARHPVDWSTLKFTVDDRDVTAKVVRKDNLLVYSPSEPWTPGLHQANVTFVDAEAGCPFTAKKTIFCGDMPSGGPRVTLRDDGVTLVDGKPFFPVGIYGVMKREFNGFDLDRGLRELAAGGFNLVHSYTVGRTKEFLDLAHKNGLKTWTAAYTPDAQFVDTFRHHPAVIAWYVGDDTAMHFTPSQIYDRVDGVKAIDPTRITVQADVMNGGDPVTSYRPYVKTTDGFLPEIYPVHKKEQVPDPACVAQTVRDMERFKQDVADTGDSVPHAVWPIIQYFRGWSGWKRFPTRDELYAMSFAALAHGAHGITWYTYGGTVEPKKGKDNHGITDTPEIWSNMTNLAWRIRSLEPALLARPRPQPPPAKVLSGPAADFYGNPSISLLVKRHESHYYVITVNGTTEEVSAELNLGIHAEDAEVLWENRRVALNEGRLTDRFAPFAVHVYRIADPIEYIAHQGEEALAPSHSRAAYRLAVKHGLDYLKLDVRRTKDGKIILQHDDNLKSVMGWDVKIKDVTLAEILEKGRCRPRGGYTNETAVTLAEALQIAKGTRHGVWIDFKDFSPEFAEQVFAELDAAGFGPDRVKVATFSKPALRWVQKNRPAVPRVAHTFIQQLPEGGYKSNAGSANIVSPTLEAVGDALEAHARDYGLHGFNLPRIMRKGEPLYNTPPELVARLTRAGYWISIWFAYESETAEFYRAAGADAFVTNWKERTFPEFVAPPKKPAKGKPKKKAAKSKPKKTAAAAR